MPEEDFVSVRRDDVETVVKFVLAWFPSYEDAIKRDRSYMEDDGTPYISAEEDMHPWFVSAKCIAMNLGMKFDYEEYREQNHRSSS